LIYAISAHDNESYRLLLKNNSLKEFVGNFKTFKKPADLDAFYNNIQNLHAAIVKRSNQTPISSPLVSGSEINTPATSYSSTSVDVPLALNVKAHFENYIPFAYQFDDEFNTLTVIVNGNIYDINCDKIVEAIRGNKDNFLDHKNPEEVKKFIALKINALILSEVYQESYDDLIDLSFEDFCDPQCPVADKSYQHSYDFILYFFKLKEIIKDNEPFIIKFNDTFLLNMNYELNAMGRTFKIFVQNNDSASFAQLDTYAAKAQEIREALLKVSASTAPTFSQYGYAPSFELNPSPAPICTYNAVKI
jgi:hypothetical protein